MITDDICWSRLRLYGVCLEVHVYLRTLWPAMRLKQTFSVASLSILPFRPKLSHSRMPQIDVLQVRKTASKCHELHATAVRSVMHEPPSGIVLRLTGSGLQILYILGWVFGPCPCMYNFDGKEIFPTLDFGSREDLHVEDTCKVCASSVHAVQHQARNKEI